MTTTHERATDGFLRAAPGVSLGDRATLEGARYDISLPPPHAAASGAQQYCPTLLPNAATVTFHCFAPAANRRCRLRSLLELDCTISEPNWLILWMLTEPFLFSSRFMRDDRSAILCSCLIRQPDRAEPSANRRHATPVMNYPSLIFATNTSLPNSPFLVTGTGRTTPATKVPRRSFFLTSIERLCRSC